MSRLARLRAVPWLLLFEAARLFHAQVMDALSPRDRRRVGEILRKSRGMPQNVTSTEREELRAIARKLDLKRLGREFAPHVVQHGRRRATRRR
jgi:hypothetical protein